MLQDIYMYTICHTTETGFISFPHSNADIFYHTYSLWYRCNWKKNKANELIQLIHTYNWYIHRYRYVWKKLSTKSGYMFSNIRPTSYTVSKLDPFMGLDQLLVSFNILPTLSKWRNNSELKAFSDLEIWFT